MARDYPNVTPKHFTTMTSGYRAAGDENPIGNYRHGPTRTPYQPASPLFTPPGSQFVYWDSAMNQLGNYLTRVAKEPTAELFRRRIAIPIGMRDEGWKWGVFGEADGIPIHCGSGNHAMMRITAVELARLGQLFLNRGRHNGKQLISRRWVDAATSPQIASDAAHGGGGYGFNWWTNRPPKKGPLKWPSAPADAYSASGFNNNDMFVIPSWNLIVVRLGMDEEENLITDAEYDEFLRLIGAALKRR
jgi:CubicO group peptidase (beta-lactamase class C family)